jgi:hypothetical protein
MSADKETILYHLKPGDAPAWVTAEDDDDSDRLLSSELTIYQGSPFGKESRHWNRVWKHPTLSESDAAALEAKYPKPEPSAELSPEMLSRLLKP